MPNCFARSRRADSGSNCHDESLRVGGGERSSGKVPSSETSSSAGCRRSISAASRVASISAILSDPLARLSHARPMRSPERCAASSRLSRVAGSNAESVSVPGVTMRVTLRSTGPLAVATSPTCSQIATDSPSFTSLARYWSMEWKGTPAMRIGCPADAPRVVSVMSSIFAARTASSKNSS